MKKIFVLSVGRSDYDRYLPILEELKKNSSVNLYLILSSDHYASKFGNTIKENDIHMYYIGNFNFKSKTIPTIKFKNTNNQVSYFNNNNEIIDMNIKNDTGNLLVTWRVKESKGHYYVIDLKLSRKEN